MTRKSRLHFALAALALTCTPSLLRAADMIEVGSVAADGVVLRWIGQSGGGTSVRAAVAVDPVKVTLPGGLAILASDSVILPMEAVVSTDVATGEVQLTRARASLLRTMILQTIPAELLTGYRDLDRGITWGADLVGFRVPIQLTANGEIVVLPGIELGVRHYSSAPGSGGDVDVTGAHASLVVDARATYTLIEGWLSTGILARVRGDAVTGGMSGVEASGTGFLALALDNDQKLHLRIYGGAEYDSNRENLGLPSANVYGGLGLFGNFGTR